jgi:predicted lipoprotein with Yx(FWY)xxD motif
MHTRTNPMTRSDRTSRSNRTARTTRMLAGIAAATVLLLAACGDDGGAETAEPSPPAPPAEGAAAGDSVAVRLSSTPLGDILVGADGMTLYGFTNDTGGVSTCTGTCAEAWPPVLVPADWTVGPELDSGVFSTVRRDDGSEQLVAGQWPLYYYAGDATQGDLTGQGAGDVWFVVGTDTRLISDPAPTGAGAPAAAAATSVQVADSPLGEILVDGDGNTLYGFTNDADGEPTCEADCAATWPAHVIEGEPAVGEGLDPAVFSVVDAVDGGTQLKAGKWPLYRFAGDSAPGDVNGQGSGGVWFVVAADGTLVQDAAATEAAATDGGSDDTGADDGDSDGGDSDGGDYGY